MKFLKSFNVKISMKCSRQQNFMKFYISSYRAHRTVIFAIAWLSCYFRPIHYIHDVHDVMKMAELGPHALLHRVRKKEARVFLS